MSDCGPEAGEVEKLWEDLGNQGRDCGHYCHSADEHQCMNYESRMPVSYMLPSTATEMMPS